MRLLSSTIVFLAMVLSGSAVAQDTPIRVTPPPGVTLHYTNPQMVRDASGAIFAATRANSDIGGVVWMVKDGVTTIVLQLGPDQMFANGELMVWPDGWLYYITVDKAAAAMTAYRINEWTP